MSFIVSEIKRMFRKDNTSSVGIADMPDEILTKILGYVDTSSLLGCRMVCSYWYQIIDRDVWKLKLKTDHRLSLKETVLINNTAGEWTDLYLLNKKLKVNLLKNNCGQEKFKHWTIESSMGDGWKVENPPVGANKLQTVPTGSHLEFYREFCFATSYGPCSKKQLLDLIKEGFTPALLDDLQPSILISEWYAGRFDCGCVYKLQVDLLDEDLKMCHTFEHEVTIRQWEGKEWHKVEHTFHNYGPGVRYISFYHEGQDTQGWAGTYGSKMTGGSIMLSLNHHLPAPPTGGLNSKDLPAIRRRNGDTTEN